MSKQSLIGPSVSIKEGAFTAIRYSHSMNGNVTQFYLGSPHSGKLENKSSKVSVEDIQNTKTFCKATGHIILVHGITACNMCHKPSVAKHTFYRSMIYDLETTEKLGGIGVVIHLGRNTQDMKISRDEAIKNMANNIEGILDNTEETAPNTKLIIETGAGDSKGNQICTTLEEFATLWNMIPQIYHARLGICVDTAHIFSAGYNINTVDGVKSFLDTFDKLLDFKNLTCFHINDSKVKCNSQVDRHEGIGQGYIFDKTKEGSLEALYEIHKFATRHQIPMALETHKAGFPDVPEDAGKYAQEVALFRKWDKSSSIPKKIKLVEMDISHLKSKFREYLASKDIEYQTTHKKESGIPSDIKAVNENNNLIVNIFNQLRIRYQAKEDHIRGSSYQRVVYQLKNYPDEIIEGKQVRDLKGIGPKIVEKIDEILATKTLKLLNNLNEGLPEGTGFNEMSSRDNISLVHGFGPKIIEKLHKLNIKTISDLRKAYNEKTINLNDTQIIGLQCHADLQERIPREEAKQIYDKVKQYVSPKYKPSFKSLKVHLAGSYPSGKSTSKDIDILITSSDLKTKDDLKNDKTLLGIVELLSEKGLIKHTLSVGSTKFLGLVKIGDVMRHMDIRLVPESVYPFAYFHYTSGGQFNKIIREDAKSKGYKLSEWGVEVVDEKKAGISKADFVKKVKDIKTDKDIFEVMGLDYVPMENRR